MSPERPRQYRGFEQPDDNLSNRNDRNWLDDLDNPERADDRLKNETGKILKKFPEVEKKLKELLTTQEFQSLRIAFDKSDYIFTSDPPTYIGILDLKFNKNLLAEGVMWRGKTEFRKKFKEALLKMIKKIEKLKPIKKKVNWKYASPEKAEKFRSEFPQLNATDYEIERAAYKVSWYPSTNVRWGNVQFSQDIAEWIRRERLKQQNTEKDSDESNSEFDSWLK